MTIGTVPLIEVHGPPRERGRQQGEAARQFAASMVDAYQRIAPGATGSSWEMARDRAQELLPPSEAAFPAYMEELRGLAEGAGLAFEDVWLLNCYEELETSAGLTACTSLAVRGELTAGGHVLLAHNEDWISFDREHVYLLRSEPEGEPPFLGFTFGALLPNIGFNAEGVAVAINSVYPTDECLGVPRLVFSRAVLAARTIGEAIARCVFDGRAGGYNYLLADENGELYCVETSALEHDVIYADEGWIAHTNHYLSPKMQAVEQPGAYAGSIVRLNRARRLLWEGLGGVEVVDLQGILRDHVNHPRSICGHEDVSQPAHERGQTVLSLVMDLNERSMWVAPGPPCEGEYVEYRLG
jgi:isopenicillin-N N-acyltransferase-like protein